MAKSAAEAKAKKAPKAATSPRNAAGTTQAKRKVPPKSSRSATAPSSAAQPKKKLGRAEFLETYEVLKSMHPDAHCELEHKNPFELLVATVLSAQTTDVAVNKATPALFARFGTAPKLAKATTEEVEACINTIGMFRQKAKNIVGLAKQLVAQHGGEVPQTQAELVALPGVGRKTANVVLGVAFQTPEGVVVDTHVQRITQRLGWTKNTTPEAIEDDLMKLLPRSEWDRVSHTLIFHGRRVCAAQRPACASCSASRLCPSAFHAENVGRKPPRVRA